MVETMQQNKTTIPQEPVSHQAMNTVVEGNPWDVATTQKPATLIENLDVWEDTVPEEPVLIPLKKFVDLDLEQEEHNKKEILTLTTKVSALRMVVIKWKSQVEENQKKMIALSEHRRIIRSLEE